MLSLSFISRDYSDNANACIIEIFQDYGHVTFPFLKLTSLWDKIYSALQSMNGIIYRFFFINKVKMAVDA